MIALWVAAALAVAAAGTWLARGYALRRRMIDQPGERRSHQLATPRGGGIAMVVVLLLALAVLAARAPGHAVQCALGAAGLALVAGIGWIDDHRPLSALLRLGVHVFAAGLLCLGLWFGGAGPTDLATAFLAAVVLTNVWNFMDGIDGIAASQAAVAACAYALFAGQGPVLWLGLALAAGACGFLPFNFPRARIFMGDVGSGALGYALAGLLAISSIHAEPGARLLLLFPLVPFVLDASLTLLSRIVGGDRWWEAHTQHAYQAWARRRGHVHVTLHYAAATIVASSALLVMRSWSPALIMLSYLTCLALGGIAWTRLRERRVDDGAESPRNRKP